MTSSSALLHEKIKHLKCMFMRPKAVASVALLPNLSVVDREQFIMQHTCYVLYVNCINSTTQAAVRVMFSFIVFFFMCLFLVSFQFSFSY